MDGFAEHSEAKLCLISCRLHGISCGGFYLLQTVRDNVMRFVLQKLLPGPLKAFVRERRIM